MADVSTALLPGYWLKPGQWSNRSLLVKFMQRTYSEIYPSGNFAHLATTVEDYFSEQTPLWWVGAELSQEVVGCLWLGSAVDQVRGDRYTHVFLIYVLPEHRRRGIGTALMTHAESWAKSQGHRQVGLQVLQTSQAALSLYKQRNYQSESLYLVKPLVDDQN